MGRGSLKSLTTSFLKPMGFLKPIGDKNHCVLKLTTNFKSKTTANGFNKNAMLFTVGVRTKGEK